MTFCFHGHKKELIQKAKNKVKFSVKSYKQLNSLNTVMSKAVRVDLNHGIRTFKKKIPKEALRKAIETGSSGYLMQTIPWDDLHDHLDPMKKNLGKTLFNSSGIAIGALGPSLQKELRFDINNPRIRDYVNKRTGELITNITKETQNNVSRAVTRSFTKGQTPKQVADQIVGSIGLLPQHETAVFNYQSGLEQQGIDPDRIDTLVENYQDKLLDYRSNMIARTEVARANNEGQLTVWNSAADQGLIDGATATKVWVVDGNPCDICDPMDGEEVGLNDAWILDDGTVCYIPTDSHPHCMCMMTINFGDGTKQTEDDEGED